MTLEMILFFVLALIAAVSAVITITRLNPVMSAISLIVNFFALAGLYLLLDAQFIAVVQVIVYAGAIMVLFLFVLMLLNLNKEIKIFDKKKHLKYFSILIAALVFAEITYLLIIGAPSHEITQNVAASIQSGTIEQIGNDLYTKYIIPFEAAGFLLLAATIGALVLAKKKFK